MAQPSIDAVLAGTKGFAVALLAPVTTRVGVRPRVAADAGQVLGLCGAAAGGLVVVEFMGEGSLAAIQALVRDARRLRVVAGVPAAHAGADETLRALGVEVARWDGKVEGMLGAIERVLGGAVGAPPQAPSTAPAAARPAPAGPAPVPVPGQPRQAPPPAAAQPGAIASRPAQGAGPAVAPRPSAPQALPVAPRPPYRPPQAGGPAPRPGQAAPAVPRPPVAPSAPRLQAVAAPPAAGAAPPVALRPAPAVVPPAPPAVVPAAPPAVAPRVEAAPVAPRPEPAAQLFDDLDGGDLNVDVADLGGAPPVPVAPGVDLHAPGTYVPPTSSPRLAWPAGVCPPDQAEEALRHALSGGAQAGGPLGALAERTLESLSDLERAVLAGEPQSVDATPIRKAAVMRLRVAEALDTAPQAGSGIDSAALSGILGEIDALLAEVAPLLTAAPAELVPALETIRNALVSEAIDFSEAAQRVAAEKAIAAPAAAIARKAGAVRVLENYAERERAPERRRLWPWIWLGLAVAGVGAYHVHRLLTLPKPSEVATVPGAPEGLRLVEVGDHRSLVALPGAKIDPLQLENFRAQQALKGIEVRELAPGMYALIPATPSGGGTK